ncbi:hypothetical protein LB516_20995 [Mesorhizobium sp. CO1-1-7]|uniref:hypothetical protein n=1 Tax=unclassified Mesorhizobium TaxID=325217 RepID=UPI00112A56B4|nr:MULTISPECIES: hypothetical protein [unclassified Mesorhizobium]MBZ9747724.1 hypothetical protein [Mesorhizobium sp. CO1-1-7]TPK73820.1 hypothetical protein FJ527_21915 [Mesorhizobium sp. B2-4-18]TPL79361.1 hypothetical protein FJ950_28610 [Mesorhizobium sp. B2-3-14]
MDTKTLILGTLALCLAAPTISSAAEADVVISAHHRHHHNGIRYNDEGVRLHYRPLRQIAFYDSGDHEWRHRHDRRDTVTVTNSVHRHNQNRPVVIQQDGGDND